MFKEPCDDVNPGPEPEPEPDRTTVAPQGSRGAIICLIEAPGVWKHPHSVSLTQKINNSQRSSSSWAFYSFLQLIRDWETFPQSCVRSNRKTRQLWQSCPLKVHHHGTCLFNSFNSVAERGKTWKSWWKRFSLSAEFSSFPVHVILCKPKTLSFHA